MPPPAKLHDRVVPPPGVSSTDELAVHRLHEPPADRQTRARRPLPFDLSPSRWNGWNTSLALRGGDARAPVDDPEVDPARDGAGARPRPCGRSVTSSGRSRPRWRPLARAARGRRGPAGASSGTSTSTRAVRSPRPARAAGTTSSRPTGRSASSSTPAWSRLMSSRFPTSVVSRSVSSSIVAQELLGLRLASTRRRPGSRLVTEALIDASGVRRSCDTACSSAVRSSFASAERGGLTGLGPEPAASRRPPRAGRRTRCSTRWSSALRPCPASDEHSCPRRAARSIVGRPRATWARARRRRPRPPIAVAVTPQHRHRVEPERRAEVPTSAESGSVLADACREARRALSASAPARAASAARRGRRSRRAR